jgi:hypothetical protein
MVEPLTAKVIVFLFFSEAIKEYRKALGEGAADTFTLIINTIREEFKAEGTEGWLKRAENDPTQANKIKLQEELQNQMDAHRAFAWRLKELVEKLQAQDEKIRQAVLSEIVVTGDLNVLTGNARSIQSQKKEDQEETERIERGKKPRL